MYIQEDKINDNKKAENNLKTSIQDVRIREKKIQLPPVAVVQRDGEEEEEEEEEKKESAEEEEETKELAEEEVVKDKEVTDVKRGNVAQDIRETKGSSYWDVKNLKSVLDEFYVQLQNKAYLKLQKEEEKKESAEVKEEKKGLRLTEDEYLRLKGDEYLRLQKEGYLRLQEDEYLRLQEEEYLRLQEEEYLRLQEEEYLRSQEEKYLQSAKDEYLRLKNGKKLQLEEDKYLQLQHFEKLISTRKDFEPYIHADMIRMAKVGNCVDFARLVYTKLVEKGNYRFIYQCYLDKKISETVPGNPNLVVNIIFNEDFDFNNKEHCKNAKVLYGNKVVTFEEYINGTNASGRKYQIAKRVGKTKIRLPKKTIELINKQGLQGPLNIMQYTFSSQKVEKLKQKYDHAFVITSGKKVNEISELDENEAIVVDAWANINPKSLANYLKDEDVYDEKLDAHDIKIAYQIRSTGLGEYSEVRTAVVEPLMKQIVSKKNFLDGNKIVSEEALEELIKEGKKKKEIFDLKALNGSTTVAEQDV